MKTNSFLTSFGPLYGLAALIFVGAFVLGGPVQAADDDEISDATSQTNAVPSRAVATPFVTQPESEPTPVQPSAPQIERERIEIYHTGINSTIHVVQQTATPAAGVRILTLPAMAANIAAWADGAPLQVDRLDDPPSQSSPALRVQVNIPAGVNLFSLEYDQLDGALPYEQTWYLEHEAAWGPLTATVHLPVTANIARYEGVEYATVVAPNVLQFDVPEGVYWGLFVVYSTTETPDLYDTVRTPHFLIHLPRAYADYQDALASLLENTYTLFQEYSHQDVNQLAHHAYYEYYYLPGGWYWWGSTIALGGGLTVAGGPSVVNARFVPYAKLSQDAHNFLVALTLHELGNGWWLLLDDSNLPWWVNGEGHSGFLRAQAELDLGYCADAQREQSNHYADYLICRQNRADCGEETILISLRQKYGWQPLRNIYAAAWDGTLNLAGLSDEEKDSQLAVFWSQQVNENLTDFFRSQNISVTLEAENLLRALPVGDVPIIETLTCPAPAWRFTPKGVQFTGPVGGTTTRTETIYVSAPVSWTASILPPVDWLTVTRASANNLALVRLGARLVDLPVGIYTSTLTLTPNVGPDGQLAQAAAASELAPAHIPVTLTVALYNYLTPLLNHWSSANLVQNSGFEEGEYNALNDPPGWSKDLFLPSGRATWDNVYAHTGSQSIRLTAPEANDIRWIQTIPVEPHASYVLSGWIKTEQVTQSDGVVQGGGNLGIFNTWNFAPSPGLYGDNDWTYISLPFDTGDQTSITVACRLGYWSGTATGTIWCDDISVHMR